MRSPRIFPTNLLYWLNILCVLIVSYRRADEVFAFEADSGSESGWRECVV